MPNDVTMRSGHVESKNGALQTKSFAFAVRVVNLHKFLVTEKREFVLSKQLLRSGTAIGALVREAEQAESKSDFIHKLAISLKDANETEYWILPSQPPVEPSGVLVVRRQPSDFQSPIALSNSPELQLFESVDDVIPLSVSLEVSTPPPIQIS